MKLSNVTSKAIFSVAFVSIFLTFIISILFQYKNFDSEIEHIKKDYITLKKSEIKREVNKVFNTIIAKESQINNEIRKKLKNRINIAHETATAIYNENKNIKSDDEIKYIIISALKNISFSENRAYFFINTNKGKAVLFNKQSKLNENKNIWNLKDMSGKYFIQEQAKIALEKDEGFLNTHFVKPDLNDAIQYPKLSYVKNFKPYNWHIGMGEYLDDMTFNIKQKILEDIASIRFAEQGYIFVNSLNKKALVFDGKKLSKPKDYTNDSLFKKQLIAIENKHGDFLFYKFKKLNTTEEFSKIAFAKKYVKWDWIIGSGAYIDEIDKEIERRNNKHLHTIINQFSTILMALLILLVIIYFISAKMSQHLNTNITHLITSFKNASRKYEKMDTDKLSYSEFKSLAKSLNKTLKSRNETEQQLQDYIKIVNEHVIIYSINKKGIFTSASEAFCKISGYKQEELIGKSHNIIRHTSIDDQFDKEIWEQINQGLTWTGEIKNKDKFGNSYWVSAIIKPNYQGSKITGFTAIKQDISDKKKVEYLSITDELTGLNNRRHFNKVIKDEINRAKRDNHYLSFMMLDIDYFKKYNDTYGHHAGDLALKKISTVLTKHTKRVNDFSFRLGGEEFGIIFSSDTKEKSLNFTNLIKEDIEKLEIEHKTSKSSKFITTSIGLVVKRGSNITTSDDLYKSADESLYSAKEAGRNTVVLA